MDSTVGGGSMKQEDEWGRILREAEKWGEYTWLKEKMVGVGLKEGKNGGSTLRGRKKWGSTHLRPRGYEHPPPQGVFGTFPNLQFWSLCLY